MNNEEKERSDRVLSKLSNLSFGTNKTLSYKNAKAIYDNGCFNLENEEKSIIVDQMIKTDPILAAYACSENDAEILRNELEKYKNTLRAEYNDQPVKLAVAFGIAGSHEASTFISSSDRYQYRGKITEKDISNIYVDGTHPNEDFLKMSTLISLFDKDSICDLLLDFLQKTYHFRLYDESVSLTLAIIALMRCYKSENNYNGLDRIQKTADRISSWRTLCALMSLIGAENYAKRYHPSYKQFYNTVSDFREPLLLKDKQLYLFCKIPSRYQYKNTVSLKEELLRQYSAIDDITKRIGILWLYAAINNGTVSEEYINGLNYRYYSRLNAINLYDVVIFSQHDMIRNKKIDSVKCIHNLKRINPFVTDTYTSVRFSRFHKSNDVSHICQIKTRKEDDRYRHSVCINKNMVEQETDNLIRSTIDLEKILFLYFNSYIHLVIPLRSFLNKLISIADTDEINKALEKNPVFLYSRHYDYENNVTSMISYGLNMHQIDVPGRLKNCVGFITIADGTEDEDYPLQFQPLNKNSYLPQTDPKNITPLDQERMNHALPLKEISKLYWKLTLNSSLNTDFISDVSQYNFIDTMNSHWKRDPEKREERIRTIKENYAQFFRLRSQDADGVKKLSIALPSLKSANPYYNDMLFTSSCKDVIDILYRFDSDSVTDYEMLTDSIIVQAENGPEIITIYLNSPLKYIIRPETLIQKITYYNKAEGIPSESVIRTVDPDEQCINDCMIQITNGTVSQKIIQKRNILINKAEV